MEKVFGDDDLLEEILLRLPAEIVHGFKPVSKHWCNLISSQSFRRRHATCHLHLHSSSRSSSRILMIDQKKGTAACLIDVRNGVADIKLSNIETDKLLSLIRPFYEMLKKEAKESEKIELRIHDAYNGLFLFSIEKKESRRTKYWFHDDGEVYYFVCNPLTKEYHELPLGSKHKSPPSEVAFAPSKPDGYYKVIVASMKRPRRDIAEYIIKIYSSDTRTWNDVGRIRRQGLYESKTIVWDNCLLVVAWCIWWRSQTLTVLDSERLYVSYSSSLLPSLITKEPAYGIVYMGESGGFLYVIVEEDTSNRYSEENQHTLWEKKGVDGAWREKFQFKTKKDKDTRNIYKILHVHREGEHVWFFLLLLNSNDTIYYCLDGNIESLQKAGDVAHSYWDCNIRSYSPTLCPLGG